MPKLVLVTGFDPFGDAPRNPSGDVARALDGRSGGGYAITSSVLPVLWDTAGTQLLALVREVNPDVVLCLGMAMDTFRVESQADNRRISHPDNAGRLPDPQRDEATVQLPARLPVQQAEAALRTAGVRVEASRDAGGFICNEVFFTLMSGCRDGRLPTVEKGGFLHVPDNENAPGMDTMKAAVEAVIEATLEHLE